jgi:hypothetical protein
MLAFLCSTFFKTGNLPIRKENHLGAGNAFIQDRSIVEFSHYLICMQQFIVRQSA